MDIWLSASTIMYQHYWAVDGIDIPMTYLPIGSNITGGQTGFFRRKMSGT